MKSKKKTKTDKKSSKTPKSKKKKKDKTTILGRKLKEALEDVLGQEKQERQWKTEVIEQSIRPPALSCSSEGEPTISWFPKWLTKLFKK